MSSSQSGSNGQGQNMSYYQILNVDPQASDEEVKKAYHRMAIKFHPDHNPQNREMSQHRFHLITEAYSKIKTQKQRVDYNRWLTIQREQQMGKAANTNKQSWLSRLSRTLVGQIEN